jgi:tRNA nucleotidyltransferase/poly(A) polymerase
MEKEIDPSLEKLIVKLADIVKLDSFVLFGGAVLDTILKRPVADYDIGIEGNHVDERLTQSLEALESQGFSFITKAKEYPIWNTQLAYVTLAKKEDVLLDIAVLPSYDNIRFFTVDSMYVQYPELKIIDEYDAMGAYDRQEIKLARRIDQENPYRIATRAIRIGAKYGFPLQNAGALWGDLALRLREWKPDSEFQGPYAYAEACAKTFRAIVRSKDQPRFSKELLETNILSDLFPELIAPLEYLQGKDEQWSVTSDTELIEKLLSTPVQEDEKQALIARIDTIKQYDI